MICRQTPQDPSAVDLKDRVKTDGWSWCAVSMEKGECLDLMGFVDKAAFFWGMEKKNIRNHKPDTNGWFIDLILFATRMVRVSFLEIAHGISMPFFFVAGHHRLTENTAFFGGILPGKINGWNLNIIPFEKEKTSSRKNKKTIGIYDKILCQECPWRYKMLLLVNESWINSLGPGS